MIYEPSREKIGGFKGIIFLLINGSAGSISLEDIFLSNIMELIKLLESPKLYFYFYYIIILTIVIYRFLY